MDDETIVHAQGGCHLLVTISQIHNPNLLCYVEPLQETMMAFIRAMDLHVMAKCHHQFQPWGATLLYLLSESHFSAHTFVETNKIILDLFCCSSDMDISRARHLFETLFAGNITQFDVIYRQ